MIDFAWENTFFRFKTIIETNIIGKKQSEKGHQLKTDCFLSFISLQKNWVDFIMESGDK